ncbi:MAG: outer membrane beta-barrel protein [Bacteroidota bacterium]
MSSELFERKLREKFAEAKVAPPPDLWDKIAVEVGPPPRKKRGLWLWFFALLGLFSTAALSYWSLASWEAGWFESMPLAAGMVEPAPEAVPLAKDAAVDEQVADLESVAPEQSASFEPQTPASSQQLAEGASTVPPVSTALSSVPSNIVTTSPNSSHTLSSLSLQIPATHRISSQVLESGPAPMVSYSSTHQPQSTLGLLHAMPFYLHPYRAPGPAAKLAQPVLAGAALREKGWAFYLMASQAYEFNGIQPILLSSAGNVTADFAAIEQSDVRVSNQGNVDQVVSVTFPHYNWSLSALVERKFSPRWSVQTGLGFRSYEAGFTRTSVISTDMSQPAPTGEQPVALESLSYSDRSYFQMNQLEIPLMAHVRLWQKNRHSLRFGLGGSVQMTRVRIGSDGTINDPITYLNQAENAFLRRNQTLGDPDILVSQYFYSSLLSNLQYRYALKNGLQLVTGPTAAYHLTPAYGGPAASRQMRFRVGWSLGFRLGK